MNDEVALKEKYLESDVESNGEKRYFFDCHGEQKNYWFN